MFSRVYNFIMKDEEELFFSVERFYIYLKCKNWWIEIYIFCLDIEIIYGLEVGRNLRFIMWVLVLIVD